MPPSTTFISKAWNFYVTLETEGLPMRDAQGVVVARTPGKRAQFHKRLFQANEKAARELGYASPAELVEKLRSAATFNSEFFEKGNEPGAIRPSDEQMHEWITDAGLRHNVDRLKELRELETVGDGERGGHNRPGVLSAIDTALGVITEGREGKRRPGRPHPPKAPVEA